MQRETGKKPTMTTLFMTPVRSGFLSSTFGPRWGKIHQGIDLAAEEGESIAAAAGGVVTFSGWASGYGKLLEIDHGSGYITRYGHCSSLKYKTGQVCALLENTVKINPRKLDATEPGRGVDTGTPFTPPRETA